MKRCTLTGSTVTALMILTAGVAVAEPRGDDRAAAFERDRDAILAMAGEYRVRFQFMETVPLRTGYDLKKPYEADATEFVEVVEDTGDRIVLQHILVLNDEDAEADDGEAAEPRVVKHWRQDWAYEATELVEYRGHRTWATRKRSPGEVSGTWTQTVYQVDDSPRYSGVGRWTHEGNLSSWQSNPTWRPLPRREYTKRDDYHVLVAVNRHTIYPDGWYHEQDNYKLVLDESGEPIAEEPILCREVGLNQYDRIEGHDFSAGRAYWSKTGAFWSRVRAAWLDRLAQTPRITLRGEVDGKRLYKRMFERAKRLAEAERPTDVDASRRWVEQTIDRYVIAE